MLLITVKCREIEDILSNPYGTRIHGIQKSLNEVREQMISLHESNDLHYFDNITYETYNVTKHDEIFARYTKRQIGIDVDGQLINGRFYRLENPLGHFSILEPLNGCSNGTALTRQSAEKRKCIIATNAGFFNTKTGDCLGNVISDGKIVQKPGTHNVNFGITKDGKFITGYIDVTQQFDFDQLVGGVIWLVRNGLSYVNVSETLEDMTTQETGPTFVTVRAGRIALGHDLAGRIMILAMDGEAAHKKGPNLHEMAQLMIDLGAVNAINLDGGGSCTVIENGSLINYVSDRCPGSDIESSMSRCERRVTTITCIHDGPEQNSNEMNWKPLAVTFATVSAVMTVVAISMIISFVLLLRRYRSYNVSVSN
jgi:exopolysaccharide biosynthesis protein